MALRAFHDNPCIGGFGGESTVSLHDDDNNKSGDAFCQIMKELVDNAFDACQSKKGGGSGQRVKVEILPYDDQILKIQVSDTGIGMQDIRKCVTAFESSKGRSTEKTAGRYGVGLTLCMLHAQRLVSNSYCCITSATREQESYTRAFFVVDTDGNSVVCKKVESLKKPTPDESGTCVSVLVPGGVTAETAWPRVENYFTRFRLRPQNFGPDLEVLAPTLSKQPIFVKSPKINDIVAAGKNEEQYEDDLEDDDSENDDRPVKPLTAAQLRLEAQRKASFRAAQSFFGDGSVQQENVAYAVQNIRLANTQNTSEPTPKLEMEIIVRPDCTESLNEEPIATLRLIRMVNSIPMLDSAEGFGCGLVHGIANKLIWGSFGLQVTQSNERNPQQSWTPLFDVRDSDQVASFFQQRHQHRQSDSADNKKRKKSDSGHLLPAKVRLSDITVVVRIQAAPSTLPLPTLSKGRLPLNHSAIDVALQRCLRECLRSLQKTNPQLLLTPAQLRSTVREVRYIPALALAVSQIICRSANDENDPSPVVDDIHQWKMENDQRQGLGHNHHHHLSDHQQLLDEATICTLTEERLRCMLECKQRRTEEQKLKKARKSKVPLQEENQYSNLDESEQEEDESVQENPTRASQDEATTPNKHCAWKDFTEIFRNPPSVSPESPLNDSSPEKASHSTNSSPVKGSRRSAGGSSQDSIADDDWW